MLKDLNTLSTEGIASLFAPFTKSEFADRYWATRPLHCKGAVHHSLLTHMDPRIDISSFLNNPHMLTGLECQMRSIGGSHAVTTSKDFLQGLSRGETLQLRQLHTILSRRHPLVILARELELFLGHPLDSISVFVAPPETQALAKHYDETEIFTLQLTGTKRWALYGDSGITEIEIFPGDLLYVPARFWHEVRAASKPSVSVAFVFRPLRLNSVLVEIVRNILHNNQKAQATLPVIDNNDDMQFSKYDFENCISGLVNELKSINSELFIQMARHLALIYSGGHGPNLMGGWWAGSSLLELKRNPYTQFLLETGERFTRVHLATGAMLTFPAYVEPELRRILEDNILDRGDIVSPYLDNDELAIVLEAMCRVGLLEYREKSNDTPHGPARDIVKEAVTKVTARSAHDAEFRQLAINNSQEAFRLLKLSEEELLHLELIKFAEGESSTTFENMVPLQGTYRSRLQPSDIRYSEPEGYER